MAYRPPSRETKAVMSALGDIRAQSGLSWKALAAAIESSFDYRVTEDQYRAAEQGVTKNVPIDLVIYACAVLNCEPAEIFAKGSVIHG